MGATMTEAADAQASLEAVLKDEIVRMYEEVADNPDAEFHFYHGREAAELFGYPLKWLDRAPAGAVASFAGVGNPHERSNLVEGETVVDLGSGAGFDALLAAGKIGSDGRFIGVDMTPEMLESARTNAVNAGYARTVEFREGLIEALPVASESADVIISNCVINLSPDKGAVFREAFRVLKPGGRLAVSDILLTEPLPAEIAESAAALISCIAGAETEDVYLGYIHGAGFADVELTRRPAADMFDLATADPVVGAAIAEFGIDRARKIASTVFSYTIEATKQ